MAEAATPWNNFPMAANLDKKAAAERRAKELYRRLMKLRDCVQPELSNNEWTRKAGVSTSFFTNMQGVRKSASEPTVGNLRLVLEAIGVSLPEFFVNESGGRLMVRPSEQALTRAFVDALTGDGLPRKRDAQAAYLASTVLKLLALPEDRPAIQKTEDDGEVVGSATTGPTHRATKRALQ